MAYLHPSELYASERYRPQADPVWWGAWLVEPALAGILITLLVFEAEILSRGLAVNHQSVGRLKRVLVGMQPEDPLARATDPAAMQAKSVVVPSVVRRAEIQEGEDRLEGDPHQ